MTVACSDTWEWAKEITDTLNFASEGEFAVFVDGKKIASRKEAMNKFIGLSEVK